MLDWYLNKDQKYVNGTMPYRHFRFQQLILSDTWNVKMSEIWNVLKSFVGLKVLVVADRFTKLQGSFFSAMHGMR